jgi:2-polyprenyl-3-methyl-5-hydroxy-6-metoxy-1,4-benzoquinol methylase
MASCRFCNATLRHTFVDLGMSPLCESLLAAEQLNHMEPFYPLHVYVCERCSLVQLQEYINPKTIFSEYAYFSSYSDTWLQHANAYVEMIVERLRLGKNSQVVEIASNDGYLLQYFAQKGIPALGIEPAANVAKAAMERGVSTIVKFFNAALAEEFAATGKQADLIVANNVLAQVAALNDFVMGMKALLKPVGVITMEVPHLMKLIDGNQFDTIYHEHFSYFSFITIETIFAAHGLRLFDVEELPTHGGSLRVYAGHAEDNTKPATQRAIKLKAKETAAGLTRSEYYRAFADTMNQSKQTLLEFLIHAKRENKSIAGYGAPGKGNTLLNYCGIRTDFIDYTVDLNPYKQGKFTPGTHIPIFHPDRIYETRPDYLLILSWNLKDEIMRQMTGIREWGGQFLVPIPKLEVYS